MMKNKNLRLDERLSMCAKLVRPGKRVVDVGADHAYLAIWLALNEVASRVVATDLREGPLFNAKQNIVKFEVEERVETRLSDGLDAIIAEEAEDVVLAGIGGELIIKIMARAPWLRDGEKHLILQPMSAEQELREFLAQDGFTVVEEQAITCSGKVYTVMSVFFYGGAVPTDELYPYIGRLGENLSDANRLYIAREIRDLKNKQKGYMATAQADKAKATQGIIDKLERLIGGE